MTHAPRAEVGVAILHGMGDPKPTFAEELIDGLQRRLGSDAALVAFEPCFWADILQESQDRIWEKMESGRSEMHWTPLRKWVVGTLGDPTGYLSGYEKGGEPVMHKVHERFAQCLAGLERELRDRTNAPLIVLAHSLGGVVATNYLWNHERAAGELGTFPVAAMPGHEQAKAIARRTFGDTPFQQMNTLTSLVTFGCNIPLFLPPSPHYECVRIPRKNIPAHLRDAARWLNIYDSCDILAYPLNDLWDVRHGTTIDDVMMSVGMPGVSLTPFSHLVYWSDGGFQDAVAAELKRVLRAAQTPLREI